MNQELIPIDKMKNVGPKTAMWLRDAGILTDQDLHELGAVEAWHRVRELYPQMNLMGLYALQASILDIHWQELPEDIKADLRKQVGR